MMEYLSLFSGIGGLDLGLDRAGMTCCGQVEIDKYCQKVLTKHWPNVPKWGDIHEFNDMLESGSITVTADLICGGFPCQPFSTAGKREGTKDERWLWPEFYRTVCAVRPGWVVIENVPGLLSIDNGRVFAGILKDLSEAGYDAEWCVISAAQVGAPHLRKRLFIVAYAHGIHADGGRHGTGEVCGERSTQTIVRKSEPDEVADPERRRREKGAPRSRRKARETADGLLTRRVVEGAEGIDATEGQPCAEEREVQPVMGRVLDGVPCRMDDLWPSGPIEQQHQWEPSRTLAGKQKDRCARLKCLGNAVVPGVAQFIGSCIVKREGSK